MPPREPRYQILPFPSNGAIEGNRCGKVVLWPQRPFQPERLVFSPASRALRVVDVLVGCMCFPFVAAGEVPAENFTMDVDALLASLRAMYDDDSDLFELRVDRDALDLMRYGSPRLDMPIVAPGMALAMTLRNPTSELIAVDGMWLGQAFDR